MDNKFGPLRILVGVTGHLDPEPEDIPEIEDKITEEIKRLQKEWPSTQIILLTGMAKGCDTIATRVALRNKLEFVAILPMPVEEFKKDFTFEEFREFEFLLKHAKKTIIAVQNNIPGSPAERDFCYKRVGMYLAGKSQILIALYNGVDTKKPAGTSEVIRFKLEGIPPHFWEDGTHDLLPGTGEVRVLSIRRKKNKEPKKPIYWSTVRPASNLGKKYSSKHFSAGYFINSFNQLVVNEINKNNYWPGKTLLDYEHTQNSFNDIDLKKLAYTQACADKLACFYRERIKKVIWYFFGLVFIATSFFEIAENIPSFFVVFHLAGILALSIVGVFWLFWKNKSWMDKEIDYRVLAEGLRVALYWRLSGINKSVADHYPSDPRGELDWVRRVLATEEILSDLPQKTERKFVEEDWFKGQTDWLKRKIHGDSKNKGFCDKIKFAKKCFVFLFILISLIQLLKIYTHGFGELIEDYSENPEGTTSFFLIIALITGLRLPALLGLAIAIFEIFGLEELVRQYERAKLVFEAGKKASLDANDLDFQKISLEVGKQALAENVEWAKIRRDRSLPEPNL